LSPYSKINKLLIAFTAVQASLFSFMVTSTADSGPGSLREALTLVNGGFLFDPHIDFSPISGSTITLSSPLPIVNDAGGSQSIKTFLGSGVTINGASAHPGLWLKVPTPTTSPPAPILVDKLHFQDCTSKGGDGGSPGGGGGAGIGAGIFLEGQPQSIFPGTPTPVILNDVTFTNCRNIGGDGGDGTGTVYVGGGGGGGALAWLPSKDGVDGVQGEGGAGGAGGGGAFGGAGGIAGAGGTATASGGGGGGTGLVGTATAFSGGDAFGFFPYPPYAGGGGGSGSSDSSHTLHTGSPGQFGGGAGVFHISNTTGSLSPSNSGNPYVPFGNGGAAAIPGTIGGAGGGGSAGGVVFVGGFPRSINLGLSGNTSFINSSAQGGAAGYQTYPETALNRALDGGETAGLDIINILNGGTVNLFTNSQMTFSGGIQAFNFSLFPALDHNYIKDGSGTVTLNIQPPNETQPNLNYMFSNLTILDGTLELNGPPTPDFSSGTTLWTQNITVRSAPGGTLLVAHGGKIKGVGTILAQGPILFATGSSLELDIGTTIITGVTSPPVFAPGVSITSTIQPTQLGSLFLVDLLEGAGNYNFTHSTLALTTSGGAFPSTPTVYVPLFTAGNITGKFSLATLNGFDATDQIFYSPPNDPNSVFFPVGVPDGYIGPANIIFGVNSLSTTILKDPCGGIIVVAFLLPGEEAAALTSFITNQSNLTLQALGASATFINNLVSKRRAAGGAPVAGAPKSPVAAWQREQKYIALNTDNHSGPNFLPIKKTDKELDAAGADAMDMPLLPTAPDKPLYSLSVTPLSQFQAQDSITTSTIILPSYKTYSVGTSVGFDYLGMETVLVGGAATYLFTELNQNDRLGKQNIHSAYGTLYSGFIFDQLSFNVLATGSYNYNAANRILLPIPGESFDIDVAPGEAITITSTGIPGGTAKASYNSYQLVPHFDISYEFGFDWFSLLPFIQSDLAISFQDSFSESGLGEFTFSSCDINVALNTATDFLITFLMQNEAGFNFFEQIKIDDEKTLILRQKASYVNRYIVPYSIDSKFLSDTEFTETDVMLPMQHFFGSAFEFIFRRNTQSIIATYEGMYGSGYLFNTAVLRFSNEF